MNRGIVYDGVPSKEELASCPGVPSQKRMKQGRVAVIECVQEIPCNPCSFSCKFDAITIGDEITNLPHLDEDKCTGCGLCVANCPGLAITIMDKSYSDNKAIIDFPFEYLPLPKENEEVEAVNRYGEVVCKGIIKKIKQVKAYAGTTVVSMIIPMEFADEVRSMKRLTK